MALGFYKNANRAFTRSSIRPIGRQLRVLATLKVKLRRCLPMGLSQNHSR